MVKKVLLSRLEYSLPDLHLTGSTRSGRPQLKRHFFREVSPNQPTDHLHCPLASLTVMETGVPGTAL